MTTATSCKHEGCNSAPDGGKGYCTKHYRAWKRGALPKARYDTCRVEGCHKRVEARGRCVEHFQRDYPGKRSAQSGETAAPAEPPAAG
jgi:hypothetical protein